MSRSEEFNTGAVTTFRVDWSDKPMTYSGRCPSCFAQHGQPCRTRKGKPARKMHNGRAIEPA